MIGFLPNFQEEKKLWRKGFQIVIGVDEVGRGSWAGSVVTAACAFTPQMKNENIKNKNDNEKVQIDKLGINDSKALPSQKREQLAEIIKDCSIWAVGEAGVGVINRLGIGKATQVAMRKAVGKVIKILRYKQSLLLRNKDIKKKSPNILISQYPNIFLLVDAFHIKYLKGIGLKNQKAIIKGDQKSISIAAASILAKVYRDNLMRKLAKKYPRYGWARNKGYGTKEHQEAILKYGMTRLHRKQFVKTFLTRSSKESPWRASKVSFRPRSIPF